MVIDTMQGKNHPITKKIAISGYYGFDNFGDEAVLEVLLSEIKDFDVTVFSSNPSRTSETYVVKSVYSFDVFKLIKTLFSGDILISGGGSLLQDVSSAKSLIYYLFVIYTALLFRKKVIMFAQGIGPIQNGLLKNLTFFALKKSDYVSVRDEVSQKLLLSENIPAKRVCDPVWNFDFETGEREKNSLGIQLRYIKGISNEFIGSLAKSVAKNFEGFKIYLVPLQNSGDIEILELFEKELKEYGKNVIEKIDYEHSSREFAKIPGKLEYFIAMRFHACLGAIKTDTNLLPIVYDPKVEALADEFELNLRLSVNDTNIDKTMSEFKSHEFFGYTHKKPFLDFTELIRELKN